MRTKHAKSVEGTKILIFDGHITHISLQVIYEARNNKIHIILLPAHTTHFLQPLDGGVFSSLKIEKRKILKEYLISSDFKDINKSQFNKLFI
jgi:hypothetical protein